MTEELLALYHKCRKKKPFMLVGFDAQCSLQSARTILEFRELEKLGVVRMRVEEEQESYFDVFGKPENGERNGHPLTREQTIKELEDLLEQLGVWWTVAEWWDGEEWSAADSCGMHTGYEDPLDPFENCYVIGEMQSAINAWKKHRDECASELKDRRDLELAAI